MNFQVGQQLFDGQIIVVSVDPDSVTLSFPQLGSMPNQPFSVTATPSVTLAALQALLDALVAVAA